MTEPVVARGDCLDVMRGMASGSVTAVVTDPPYALQFMGKGWDKVLPSVEVWRECLRVLRPGGVLLAFGGTRTFHRLTCSIEDAGFQIRDCLSWMYGSGFPKSLAIDKAIDKADGAERRVIGEKSYADGHVQRSKAPRFSGRDYAGGKVYREDETRKETAAGSPRSEPWTGYGTALKPAWEPIVVAMKPTEGTFAQNALRHGVAGINVDGCRIGPGHENGRGRDGEESAERRYHDKGATDIAAKPGPRGGGPDGRWPANVVLDAEAGATLDAQVGPLKSGARSTRAVRGSEKTRGVYNKGWAGDGTQAYLADVPASEGGPSRFFYCAKASRSERSQGCKDLLTWENEDQSSALRGIEELQTATFESGALDMAAKSCSTDLSGRLRMDQSPTDTRSATETASRTITALRAWRWSPTCSTSENIRAALRMVKDVGGNLAAAADWCRTSSQATTDAATASHLSAVAALFDALSKARNVAGKGNVHSTVKPVDLMRWLVRLVKMPVDTFVLDPFAGSGTTGVACALEGVDFLGVELDQGHVDVANRRIEEALGC